MGKYIKVKEHLKEEEILDKIKNTVGFWRVRRWLIIRNASVEKTTAENISKRIGVGKQTVLNLINAYNKHGIKAVEVTGRGQRQRAYLTKEEEQEFLTKFISKASQGYIRTVNEIHEAFEEYIGKKVSKSTIYRLLHRNNWRKIEPRPTHVKSDKKKQEAFKKTLKMK